MRDTLKSVTMRLPGDLMTHLKNEADKAALTVTETTTIALQSHFGMPVDPKLSLLKKIAEHTRGKYLNEFPEDVILRVFQDIAGTPSLKKLYDVILEGENDKQVSEQRQQLHQQIAKTIKRVLGAEVSSRSVQLTGDNLIRSYSNLVPKKA